VENGHIEKVMELLRKESKKWENPYISDIAAKSPSYPFKILISCLLSLRTKDEVTEKAAEKLFSRAISPENMANLSLQEIEKLIYPVGFYRNKAKTIKKISEILYKKYNGKVPSTLQGLLSLPGVGRKTANLVLSLGFKKPGICVDTHVHRIANRWGYVKTKSPHQTEFALREKLPQKYWIEFNRMLVAFGKTICRPISPFCSRCPVERFCDKVGVTKRR